MKIFSACLMRPLYLVIILMFLNGCEKNKEYKPLSGTEEYRQLHGIQKGKENIIEIGQKSFRLPPGVGFELDTEGKIEYVKADKLYLYVLLKNSDRYPLRIEITAGHFPDSKLTQPDEKDLRYSSSIPELGLIEYKANRYTSVFFSRNAEGYLENRILCVAVDTSTNLSHEVDSREGLCRGVFYNRNHIVGRAFFSMKELERWPEIKVATFNTTNKYMIQ
ncbi:hypothetical protein HKW97_23370 (plasmid) [Pseudomonas luteola]|uniref:hypothetical protein n=1 Tax=Pseudomonas luteola TaxID=47886 RepID=UPI00388F31C9